MKTFQIFSGNTDADTVITHDLDPPITAKYLRFRPVTWGSRIGMRAEVYGFKGNNTCCSINSIKKYLTIKRYTLYLLVKQRIKLSYLVSSETY